MNTLTCRRAAVLGSSIVLALAVTATSVFADTFLMPKREILKGQPIVVWGATTLPNQIPGPPTTHITNFTIDFGDGTTPFSNAFLVDGSFINIQHIYSTAGTFTVTLTVNHNLFSSPGLVTQTATTQIKVYDPADPLVNADVVRGIRVNNAIEDGLRYLWTAQTNRTTNWPNGTTTSWPGSNPVSWTALVVLAFENHGYQLPNSNAPATGLYERFIVERGLNFLASNYGTYSLGVQPAGNPCVGAHATAPVWTIEAAPCLGYYAESGATNSSRNGYGTAVAALPLAASGALNRTNTVLGKSYGEILQRLTNTVVWGQIDSGRGQGGWIYALNPSGNNQTVGGTSGSFDADGSTLGWAVLALLDGEAAGITVPNFAKTEFNGGFNRAFNNDGSFDYASDNNAGVDNLRNITRAGIGLQGLYYTGVQGGAAFAASTKGQNAVNTIISPRWGGATFSGDYLDTCVSQGDGQNKGCAYAMFNLFKGLKLQGVQTIPSVSRVGTALMPLGTKPVNDWYADYQDWLVNNQTTPTTAAGGNWSALRFSCCANDHAANSALAELILSPVALVLPDPVTFSTVGLSPATGTSLTGLTHTVTAHAESTGGTPVAGATVVFTVLTGPNAGKTGSSTTDGTGNASFTYTDLGAGTDTIQAKIGTTLTSNTVSMTWTVRTLTPSVTADDKVYDGNASASIASCTLAGPVLAGDVVNCISGSASFSDANVAPGKTVTSTGITLAGLNAPNYVLSTTTAMTTANITARPVTVEANPQTKVYGDADPALTYAITSGTLVGTDAFTGGLTRAAGDAVGAYAIQQDTLALSTNYALTYVGADLTITARAVTITAAAQTKTYGDGDPALTYAVSSGTLAYSDAFTGSLTRVTGEDIGSYAIEQGSVTLGGNYALSYVGADLTITTRAIAVTAEAQNKTYGDPDPPLTYLISSGTLAFGDAFAGGLSRVAGENIGPYAIEQGSLSLSGNYTLTYTGANLTIGQKTASVTPAANTKTYGSVDPALGGTLSGFLAADGVTASYSRTVGETVLGGPYTISATLSPAAVLNNYSITYNTANFAITPKAASVTPAANTKVYNSVDPVLTGSLSGFLAADGVTAGYSRVAGETVLGGPYTISATLSPASVLTNYTVTYNTANFSITPKAATVTATNRIKGVGQTVVFAGTEFTQSGFVLTDTVTSVTLTSAGAAAGATVAGSPYAIVPSAAVGSGLSNYAITYINGSLTVIGASPSTGSLWPPNHKMVPITIAVANGGAPAVCSITNVTSSEPINGLGDGDTAPDWSFTPGSLTVNLRSERSGGGNGRIYTVFVTCTLPSGSSTITTTTVGVAHDQGQ